MKTQKEVEEMKKETDRLIKIWEDKLSSDERNQVLYQLIGQRNILLEVLK